MAKIIGNTTTTPIVVTVDQTYSAESTNAQSGTAVAEAIASIVDSSPEALDTLNELAEALGNDPNFATTVLTEISKKADKATSQGGFKSGENAHAEQGGSIGKNATTTWGGSVGLTSLSKNGGAVGYSATTAEGGSVGRNTRSHNGGAVGWEARAGEGFSGGYGAKTEFKDGSYIDAIQLGTGINPNPKTLQIYDYTLMDADGTIPEERLSKAKDYTDKKVADMVNSAPETLNTLNELAEALGDDPNFATTVATNIGKKADKQNEWKGFEGGNYSLAISGGAIGQGAGAESGGAVGSYAGTISGGAVGELAYTLSGGSVGYKTYSADGGSVGYFAEAGNGFSGGFKAKTIGENGEYIDAIQLGTGTNSKPKTLQIYEHTLLNADGTIPEERLPILKTLATTEYVDSKVGSGGGESNSILGFDYYYEFDDYEKYSDVLDKEFYSPGIYKINIYETDMLDRKFYLSTHILFVSSDSDHYVYSQLEIASIGENPLIRARWGSLNESSTRIIWVDWEDYGISADYVENTAKQTLTDSKTYVDEKIGDIDTLLDSILAIEQELIGEALVDTSIAVCDSYINGGNAE